MENNQIESEKSPQKIEPNKKKKWIQRCIWIFVAVLLLFSAIFAVISYEKAEYIKKTSTPEAVANRVLNEAQKGDWSSLIQEADFGVSDYVGDFEYALARVKIAGYKVGQLKQTDSSTILVPVTYTLKGSNKPKNITMRLIKKADTQKWVVDCSAFLVPEIKIHTYSNLNLTFAYMPLDSPNFRVESSDSPYQLHKCTYIIKNVLKEDYLLQGKGEEVTLPNTTISVTDSKTEFDVYDVQCIPMSLSASVPNSTIRNVTKDVSEIIEGFFNNLQGKNDYSSVSSSFSEDGVATDGKDTQNIKNYYNAMLSWYKTEGPAKSKVQTDIGTPTLDTKSGNCLIFHVPYTMTRNDTYQDIVGNDVNGGSITLKGTMTCVMSDHGLIATKWELKRVQES